MKITKFIVCTLLCFAMLLSMTACGGAAAESTEETTSPADSYLAMAEEFVAQEKYDSAMDVLNQAKASITDPRLDAMIAEIEAARPVFLDVEYTMLTDNLESAGIQIHNVTAQVLEETVLYDIEYTAPEGMYLQVLGTSLADCWDYMVPGGKDRFAFEVDKSIACDNFERLTIVFKYTNWNYMQLELTTTWPDAAGATLVQIPVANAGNANCRVDRATVRAVSEDLLHFHVEYTTPTDQQYIAGLSYTESGEDMFFSVGVAPGKDMISFMMDRAEMENIDSIYVRLCPDGKWDDAVVAQLNSGDYTLPQAPASKGTQELTIDNTDNGEIPVEAAEGQELRIDSVLVEQTPAGNLYTLKGDFSKARSSTAYCNIKSLYYTITVQIHDPEELQFFIPADILTQAVGLFVEFWGPEGYVGYAPMVYDCAPVAATVHHPEKGVDAIPEEATPGQIVQYPSWSTDNNLTHSEVEILGLTETVLENGNLRYVLEYRATGGMLVSAFDPPNGDLYQEQRKQLTSGRREYFAFEVEKSVMDKIQYITLSFWSEKDEGNFWVYLEKNWYNAAVTDGSPVGEEQAVNVRCDSKVTVHSMKAQLLDNGYIRYTMEYTTSAGRRVSFFNQPNNDHFIYLSETLATGGQDTYVIDVPKVDNDDVSEITMKFYDLSIGDHVYARFKPVIF